MNSELQTLQKTRKYLSEPNNWAHAGEFRAGKMCLLDCITYHAPSGVTAEKCIENVRNSIAEKYGIDPRVVQIATWNDHCATHGEVLEVLDKAIQRRSERLWQTIWRTLSSPFIH